MLQSGNSCREAAGVIERFVPLAAPESGVPRIDGREAAALLRRAPGRDAAIDGPFVAALLATLRQAERPRTTGAPAPVPAGPPPLPPILGDFASATPVSPDADPRQATRPTGVHRLFAADLARLYAKVEARAR